MMKVFLACALALVSSLEHAPTVDDCSKCIDHKECRLVDGPHSRPFHCICPNEYIMKNCSKPACLRARSDDGSIIKCVIPKSILTHRPDECSEYVQKKNDDLHQEWSCFKGKFHEVRGYEGNLFYTCEADVTTKSQLFSLFMNGTSKDHRGSTIIYVGTHIHEPLNVFVTPVQTRFGTSVAVQIREETNSTKSEDWNGILHHVDSPNWELKGFYCIKLKDLRIWKMNIHSSKDMILP